MHTSCGNFSFQVAMFLMLKLLWSSMFWWSFKWECMEDDTQTGFHYEKTVCECVYVYTHCFLVCQKLTDLCLLRSGLSVPQVGQFWLEKCFSSTQLETASDSRTFWKTSPFDSFLSEVGVIMYLNIEMPVSPFPGPLSPLGFRPGIESNCVYGRRGQHLSHQAKGDLLSHHLAL